MIPRELPTQDDGDNETIENIKGNVKSPFASSIENLIKGIKKQIPPITSLNPNAQRQRYNSHWIHLILRILIVSRTQ